MTNEKYVSYKGMHFQNGFLYKKMNIKNIEVDFFLLNQIY